MNTLEIVLFRHAVRNKFIEDEPQLSPYGLKQAHYLSEHRETLKLPKPTNIWVSPRLRAQQTMSPLSKVCGIALALKSDLDERKSNETMLDFRQRIDRLIKGLSAQNGVIYLCSHLDWIEEAMSFFETDSDLLNQPGAHWSTAQFLELNYDFTNEIWRKIKTGQACPKITSI